MSDLAAPDGSARQRRGGALGTIAVLVPLVAAVVVAGPRLWHSVHSEPTGSVAVQPLPAQQPAAATELPAEQPPAPARGQLASLGRFAARDPFASPLPPPARHVAPARAPAAVPAATPLAPAAPAGAATATPVAPASAATISVNGIPEQVALKAAFPAADPVFTLAALGAGEVQIAVASGGATSAATGSQTVTLASGSPLTLLDTSSGTRYELRLVSQP